MSFAVLSMNFAYYHSLEMSDRLEELGMLKQNVKKTFNSYKSLCKDRLGSLRRQYKTQAAWYCVQDYMRIYNDALDKDMSKLTKDCKAYLKRKRIDKSEIYGEVGAVGIVWYIVKTNITRLLEDVRNVAHYDLRKDDDFHYMDVKPIYEKFRIFERTIAASCNEIDLGKSRAVINTISKMAENMYNEEMVQKGLERAIEMNKEYLKKA